MKKVGFIGAYDKTNLIMCVAKVLTMKEKRVLIVDTTAEQKFKYIVPTIHPTSTYVTTWEDMDVAVGFKNLNQILDYIGIDNLEEEYDDILINVDNQQAMNDMKIEENNTNCFITAMDSYSINKGLETFSAIEEQIKLIQIVFSTNMSNEYSNQYIDYKAEDYKIEWTNKIVFPIILDDKYVEMDNQLIYRIGLKYLSSLYKDSIVTLIGAIFNDEMTEQEAKKIIKVLEKGGI